MGVAVASRIIEVDQHKMATVDVGRARKKISLLLQGEAKARNCVMFHAGFGCQPVSCLPVERYLSRYFVNGEDVA